MATLIQYDALIAMPAPPAPGQPPQPTAQQLQTAKNEYNAAENGDGQPLPPPFTYGKVYRWLNDDNPIPKVPKAPSLSQTELKQLMKDLPKPDTQLQLPAPPIGGVPVPAAPDAPTNFFQIARATIDQRTQARTWRRIGKELNMRSVNRATRQPLRRNQDDYKLLIELSTNTTGKHTIFYSTKMTQQEPTVGPRTQTQNQQEQLGLQQSFNFPEISRKDKTPPYSKPRDKKNKKWTNISITLQKWLDSHFHKGNELAMPNPSYPDQTRFDKIFRISDFEWQFLPKSVNNLTGKKPPFKFYITNNWTNAQDPNMYIVLKVRLVGRFRKGNKINPTRALPTTKPIIKKGKLKKASSFCNNQLSDIKTIALDRYHSAPGIFTDSASEKFEKKIKKASAANITAKNIKLYYKNRTKALAYWEQEYYCRQAMNFNAGINAGWPNIAPVVGTRFPFDPWTLQPAVAMTAKFVQYPNGLPGSRAAPNGQALINLPPIATTGPMQAWYAAQPAGFQNPSWPIPFSPLGMSLRPKMVMVLFKRMNNYLNAAGVAGAGVGPPLPNVINAINILQPILVQGKLPNLTTATLTPAQWDELFILYEFVLFNRFEANEPELVLEPFEPYPRLPEPVAGAQFGTWLISRNRRQYAIPVNTGVLPWPTGADAPVAPAVVLPALIPAQAPRNRVSWQQIKKNGFYKIEAKKWAEWMILSNPFPIPGFPQYSNYIALLQRYKYAKINAASTIPQPGNALIPAQINTQCPLPPVNTEFIKSVYQRNNDGNLINWVLPSEANRTAQYINPYAAASLPAGAPGGWMPVGFLNLINAQPSISKWMFTGPIAGRYPKQIWPENNMRINGALPQYPPLEDVITINVRRSKRENLGGWQGGRRKRTLRKYRKKRKNRTLKRRRRRKK